MSDLYTLGEMMGLFLATDTDDVATAAKFELSVAGAEVNVAVAVTRLGLRATLISRLGADQLGRNILAKLMGLKPSILIPLHWCVIVARRIR